MGIRYNSFKDMPIWQEAISLAKSIYAVTNKTSWRIEYALKEQVRRAAISVSSNIAESYEKENKNEFYRYMCISKGSLGELKSQKHLAKELGYIDEKEYDLINAKLVSLGRQVGGFINYLRKKKIMDKKNIG